jgi:RND family efflux transporter MFP subunit
VSYSQAQLKLARRDLANAELRAPFDGTVSARHMEASEVAARGRRVLGIYAEGALQVAVSIPEQLIGGVSPGIEGQVLLANQPGRPYEAVVTEVGSAATIANAFPVRALISDADASVRPGMTAELRLFFAEADTLSAYLLPVHAIVYGTENDDRYIFVFDAQTSTVRKKAVQARGVRGNQAIITEGIAPGDVIVVAGVTFLRDGQQVKLFKSSESSQ